MTPDLEYDHDRSKLRDQGPIAGRKHRPRWEDNPLTPQEIKDRIIKNFYISKPPKPPGRLNAFQKYGLF
jgi:hypothetical protein